MVQSSLMQQFQELERQQPWLIHPTQLLVVKPDQLIKRRGKLGLIGIKMNWAQVKASPISSLTSFNPHLFALYFACLYSTFICTVFNI
jgi:succinyl-CoA synthetase beta subunit